MLCDWLIQAMLAAAVSSTAAAQAADWQAYGRDLAGTRYLPADQITRQNVTRLELAWTYRTGETEPRFATKKETSFEVTV